jgi:hypothetical protein
VPAFRKSLFSASGKEAFLWHSHKYLLFLILIGHNLLSLKLHLVFTLYVVEQGYSPAAGKPGKGCARQPLSTSP